MKYGPAIMWTVYALSAIVCAALVAVDEIRARRDNRNAAHNQNTKEHP